MPRVWSCTVTALLQLASTRQLGRPLGSCVSSQSCLEHSYLTTAGRMISSSVQFLFRFFCFPSCSSRSSRQQLQKCHDMKSSRGKGTEGLLDLLCRRESKQTYTVTLARSKPTSRRITAQPIARTIIALDMWLRYFGVASERPHHSIRDSHHTRDTIRRHIQISETCFSAPSVLSRPFSKRISPLEDGNINQERPLTRVLPPQNRHCPRIINLFAAQHYAQNFNSQVHAWGRNGDYGISYSRDYINKSARIDALT